MYFPWHEEMRIFFGLQQKDSQSDLLLTRSLDFSKKSKFRAREYSIWQEFNEPLKAQYR